VFLLLEQAVFHPRPLYLRFLFCGQSGMGTVFLSLQIPCFSSVSIIQPMLHTHFLTICHPPQTIWVVDSIIIQYTQKETCSQPARWCLFSTAQPPSSSGSSLLHSQCTAWLQGIIPYVHCCYQLLCQDLVQARLSAPIRPGAHPASYTRGTGSPSQAQSG
jgi:hypothetical protein